MTELPFHPSFKLVSFHNSDPLYMMELNPLWQAFKFLIGVWMTSCFQGHSFSHNIAAPRHNSTRRQMKSCIPTSELLIKWIKDMWAQVSIEARRDILTSCNNSDSNVKKDTWKVFLTLWEFCIPRQSHLTFSETSTFNGLKIFKIGRAL